MMDHGLLNKGGLMYTQASIIRQRSCRNGAFSLVEILVVVLVLPLVMVAINSLFRTFIQDVPRMNQLVQQNTTVQNLFDQMRRDVAGATALPKQFQDRQADETSLLIQQPNAVVCYRIEAGRVVRTVLGTQEGDERVWAARDAVIEWKPWTQDGNTCAVEVHSYLKQRVHGHLMRRFLSSYVFFVRGLAEGVEIQ
ncbi:MAG: hypothetical protein ABFD90_13895 [Phycisphaerales bacterium]